MNRKDQFSIDVRTDAGTLEIGQQLFQRFCEDLSGHDPATARARLVSGIQVAIRDAIDGGHTEPLYYYQPADGEAADATNI